MTPIRPRYVPGMDRSARSRSDAHVHGGPAARHASGNLQCRDSDDPQTERPARSPSKEALKQAPGVSNSKRPTLASSPWSRGTTCSRVSCSSSGPSTGLTGRCEWAGAAQPSVRYSASGSRGRSSQVHPKPAVRTACPTVRSAGDDIGDGSVDWNVRVCLPPGEAGCSRGRVLTDAFVAVSGGGPLHRGNTAEGPGRCPPTP